MLLRLLMFSMTVLCWLAVCPPTDAFAQAPAPINLPKMNSAPTAPPAQAAPVGMSSFMKQTLATLGILAAFILTGLAAMKAGLGDIIFSGKRRRELHRQRYEERTLADDEYTRLLKSFGLDEDATEGDIKKAYRKMMKVFHPDRSKAGDEEQKTYSSPEAVAKLKENYDRLVEIKKSFFGGRPAGPPTDLN